MQEANEVEVQIVWHSSSTDASRKEPETSATGLNQSEAEARLAKHGANRLPEATKSGAFIRFLLQFHNIGSNPTKVLNVA